MKYRIEAKPAFTVFGLSRNINRTAIALGDPKDEVAHFWSELTETGTLEKLEQTARGEHTLEMSWHGKNGETFSGYDEQVMPYLIGSFKKDGVDSTGYTEVNIPAATWAIFPTEPVHWGNGMIAEKMRETNTRIWSEWFPTSGYEVAELPHLGVFIWDDTGEYVEYWIPVIQDKTNPQTFYPRQHKEQAPTSL